jgi:hypothetical protein
MSTISEKIDELFRDAVHGEDAGYPNGVEFVPADEEWAERVLWRNLIEGTPTVLVSEDAEVLLMPLHPSGARCQPSLDDRRGWTAAPKGDTLPARARRRR